VLVLVLVTYECLITFDCEAQYDTRYHRPGPGQLELLPEQILRNQTMNKTPKESRSLRSARSRYSTVILNSNPSCNRITTSHHQLVIAGREIFDVLYCIPELRLPHSLSSIPPNLQHTSRNATNLPISLFRFLLSVPLRFRKRTLATAAFTRYTCASLYYLKVIHSILYSLTFF
jgi:hypothetical protein